VAKITINPERCKGCTLCINVCSNKKIKMSEQFNKAGYHPAIFVEEGSPCTGCSFCYMVCPDVCIEVNKDK